MAEPGDEIATGACGHGRLKASDADREQVIGALTAAFVHGRLTKDELEARAGQALDARTYAELAALTADLPAGPAAAQPAAEPAGTPARTLAKAASRSGICLLIPFALGGIAALTNTQSLVSLAVLTFVVAVIAASGFLGYGLVDAWQERHSGGQLPPRPTQRPRALEGEPHHRPGDDLILCQARSDARAHRPETREPATATGDDPFVPLGRHAGDQDRRAGSARPGRAVAGARSPRYPRQAVTVIAHRNACPAG